MGNTTDDHNLQQTRVECRDEAAGDGTSRITCLGGSPWNIETAELELIVRNRQRRHVDQRDANGLVVDSFSGVVADDGLRFRVPSDGMCLVLR